MEKLSIEEKAKAYDKALEKAKQFHNGELFAECNGNLVEYIFPELCEPEDEKIRKAIHIYLDWLEGRKDYAPKGKYSIKDMIAWLEKQGEQKPAWSEEDECFMEYINAIATKEGWSFEEKRKTKHWLKSLKERIGG